MQAVVEMLPDRLGAVLAAGGGNLSVGQRQLLCMARALLRRSRIVCLDEATASIDRNTGTNPSPYCRIHFFAETVIQATLRDEFAGATVITIAHRLDTVLDSTRVLVLDRGNIAEFSPPLDLLKDPLSIFYAMALAQGIRANN